MKMQLGHDTEESTHAVLRRMAEIENRQFEDQLRNVSDPNLRQKLSQALINGTDGYNRALIIW